MQNVLNALCVIEEVATRQPVGVSELSRLLVMPKSSVQRAVRTLTRPVGCARRATSSPDGP